MVIMEATRCCAFQIDSLCWFWVRINCAVGQGVECGGSVYIKEWEDLHIAKEWVITIIRDEHLT
jgi:hypothetical protein